MKDLEHYEEIAAAFNAVRAAQQGFEFNAQEFFSKVPFIGVSKCYTSIWTKYGIADKVKRGLFRFPKDPVLWSKFKYAYEEMLALQRNASKKYKQKHKPEENKKEVPELEELLKTYNFSLDDVAEYLSNTGDYKIQKKQVIWKDL